MSNIFKEVSDNLDEALFRMNEVKANLVEIRANLILQALEQGWTREEIEKVLNNIEKAK